MSFIPRQTKPAHALVDAIRHARTPYLKGEAINKETWYLNLSPEPVPPATDRVWIDIRSSGLGEVLLDIVTQGEDGGPIDDGEVHLHISSLQALHYIVRNTKASWNKKNPLEKNLREKVMTINQTLVRLEKYKFEKPGNLALAREFMVCIISTVMERLRWDYPFLDSIEPSRDLLLHGAFTCLFDRAHSAGKPGPDASLVQKAVIIVAILADNFGSLNDVSALTVSEYGVRRIIDCFLFILQDPAYRDSKTGGILTGMSAVMIHLWADASIRLPFILDGRIHVHMMNRFWKFQPNRPKDDIMELGPSGLSAVSFLCDIVEYVVRAELEDEHLAQSILRDLIVNHDIFFAFGMILAGGEKYGCFARARSIEGFIDVVLRLCDDDLRINYVVPAWLHVMKALRKISSYRGPLTFRNAQKETILTIPVWERFGEDLGMEETEMRAAIRTEDLGGAEIACANLKCPLFGENIMGRLDTPLRCSVCRSVSQLDLSTLNGFRYVPNRYITAAQHVKKRTGKRDAIGQRALILESHPPRYCAEAAQSSRANCAKRTILFRDETFAPPTPWVPKEEMIKKLFVFSDMQFDEASQGDNWETNHEQIVRALGEAGYEVPEVAYWNLQGVSGAKPVTKDTPGVAILSGFSGNMLKLFMEGADELEEAEEDKVVEEEKDDGWSEVKEKKKKKTMTPEEVMDKALNKRAMKA
ncbi:hypothetical protein FRC04_002382 [Tulasnella sp. 424]|nr:hypothetical protein FRC04_002382 [Tulasnella sp. 424]